MIARLVGYGKRKSVALPQGTGRSLRKITEKMRVRAIAGFPAENPGILMRYTK